MTAYRYLLDTNILSDLIKNPTGLVAQKIASSDVEQACCTSLIVACELRYGTCKKGSSVLTSRVEQLLYTLPVLALEKNVAQEYGEIRTALERIGQPIGGNDLLIAAHARALRLTVVTANVREFLRVPGLAVENWLE
ncbi:tRNA(fMet)-specific endonuclease VapC [Candidatus Electrothrix aarhusensis]|uniref:tRNA(fMet)-specific endonuclease VapC n=1 Tax=Candidatus Electrothrix aarhusensis TaxID=1859131 RepID=A0A444J0R6_9BACT|nr:tRNA(fMet)-specific endonuclease VapC [Candidatus Electrothrix aarhusensis]